MAPQHATLGALLIGFTISTFIFGITSLQTIQYFRTFTKDRRALKAMHYNGRLLEIFDEVLAGHAIYHYLIIEAGDIRAPAYLVWSLMVPAFTDGLSGMIIQLFFAKRVYILSESRLLYAVIVRSRTSPCHNKFLMLRPLVCSISFSIW
ncbi:hypothetical protein CPB85DRAFT_549002 [Mucidula mucida]|nr:hypothetical protein CPB85DRAFT_549002 [Mucidula mucida]